MSEVETTFYLDILQYMSYSAILDYSKPYYLIWSYLRTSVANLWPCFASHHLIPHHHTPVWFYFLYEIVQTVYIVKKEKK